MGMQPFISPVEERQLDYVLEEEFCVDPEFLRNFLGLVRQPAGSGGESTRVPPQPAQQHGCLAVRSVTTSDGESDVLVTYSVGGALPIALLIEDKIQAGFQARQAARYRERGEEGLGRTWSEYFTVLVAHERYASTSGEFDGVVTLQALREYFVAGEGARSAFRARVIGEAIAKFERSGIQQVDPALTGFRARYADAFDMHFPDGDWWKEEKRQAWRDDTWFDSRKRDWPKSVLVRHQARSGRMQLILPTRDEALLRAVLDGYMLTAGEGSPMPDVVPVGKEKSSFTLAVQPMKDFGNHSAIPAEWFATVKWLARFFDQHRGMLPREFSALRQ